MKRALKGGRVVDGRLNRRISGWWKRRGSGVLGRPWVGSFTNTLTSECNGRLVAWNQSVLDADHAKGHMQSGSD
eukprot:464349-Amphidinium_carterae.2